jgi:hypothetical protein
MLVHICVILRPVAVRGGGEGLTNRVGVSKLAWRVEGSRLKGREQRALRFIILYDTWYIYISGMTYTANPV